MGTSFAGRPLYHSELTAVGASVIWLLEVEHAGQTFRWSSRPANITNADGESLPFDGGLPDSTVRVALQAVGTAPSTLSVPVTVQWPGDVSLLESYGADLAAATGELSLWVPGGTYEDRHIVIAGRVSRPTWGAKYEPVSFSLEERPYEDAALWPPAGAVVSVKTWSGAPDDSMGAVYPWVFGSPGVWLDSDGSTVNRTGSPAVVVAVSGAAATKILIAGHRVLATSVVVRNASGTEVTGTVSHESDGLGRTVAVVDISGEATAFKEDGPYHIRWSAGALPGPQHDDPLTELGDVISWWLDRSSLRIDRGRWAAYLSRLRGIRISGYLDEVVTPWEYIADNLLPLVPVSMISGPDGMYPVQWVADADRRQVIAEIEAGPSVTRVGAVRTERRATEVRNSWRIDWAWDPQEGSHQRATSIQPDPDTDDTDQHGSAHAQVSERRYGAATEEQVETDLLEDAVSASLALSWRLADYAHVHRLIEYEVDDLYMWLLPGDVVELDDADLNYTDALAVVREVSRTDTGRHLLVLQTPATAIDLKTSTGPNPTDSSWDDGVVWSGN